jgi:hypothetical protein
MNLNSTAILGISGRIVVLAEVFRFTNYYFFMRAGSRKLLFVISMAK